MENAKKYIFLKISAAIICIAAVLSFISPAAAIGVFLFLIFTLLAVKKPFWGISALVVYISFEAFLLKFASDANFPFLKYGVEAGIVILFLAAVSNHFFIQRKKYIKTPIDKPLAFFIFITAISTLINFTSPIYWILGLRQIFRFTLLYYAIIYAHLPKDAIKKIIIILLILLSIQSFLGIGQAVIGEKADKFLLPDKVRQIGYIATSDFVEKYWAPNQRVFSTMGRYDRLGIFLCLVMLIAAGLFFEAGENDKKRKYFFLVIIFSLPALILTYSRMSWIGAALGLLFIGIAIKRNKIIIGASALAIFLFSIYLLFYLANSHIRVHKITDKSDMNLTERFLLLFSKDELKGSYDGQGRLYFIINSFKIIKKYPLFGVGLGRYGGGVAASLGNKEVYDEFNMPFGVQNYLGSIDNNWFSLWGETGTLGVISFALIIASLFVFAYNLRKQNTDYVSKGLALGFLGVIVAVSFQTFLGPYFEVRSVSFYFWLSAGMVVSLKNNL